MIFSFKHKITALTFALLVSTQAIAITVYDVIQLSDKAYSNEDIIALIKDTNSAFQLKAEDVANLLELGVNEPVIQAMLEAKPLTQEPKNKASKNTQDKSSTSVTTDENTKKPSDNKIITPFNSLISWTDFRSVTSTEKAHKDTQYQAITYSGIPLFIIKDKARYKSIAERGKAVANQLDKIAGVKGVFTASQNGIHDTVAFIPQGHHKKITIIEVTSRDAKTYQQSKKGKEITADVLITYWSELLTDYWMLAFNNQPPKQLTKFNQGKALVTLYKTLNPAIKNSSVRLARAFQGLQMEDQKRLSQLASSIPDNFIK